MPIQTQTQQLLEERLSVVPKEVRSVICGDKLNEIVRAIQIDFSLTDIQSNRLSDEILLTLLFFYPTINLDNRILESLGIDTEASGKISSYVQQSLFAPMSGIYEQTNEMFVTDEAKSYKTVPEVTASIATPNIRTMQGDIKATSQEDLLKGKQETKIDDDTPRWGNQT
ncbi:hypothetical protein KC850_01950 [Candidatus Kaiserbacteria bacterium]|nr:hypothetical protein [Candidatus Kaiserbacteria bacterium]MCB9817951.1 hypothetical protein [Candidatus Nomurabacteria bacterium]